MPCGDRFKALRRLFNEYFHPSVTPNLRPRMLKHTSDFLCGLLDNPDDFQEQLKQCVFFFWVSEEWPSKSHMYQFDSLLNIRRHIRLTRGQVPRSRGTFWRVIGASSKVPNTIPVIRMVSYMCVVSTTTCDGIWRHLTAQWPVFHPGLPSWKTWRYGKKIFTPSDPSHSSTSRLLLQVSDLIISVALYSFPRRLMECHPTQSSQSCWREKKNSPRVCYRILVGQYLQVMCPPVFLSRPLIVLGAQVDTTR